VAVLKNAINALDPQPDKKKEITLLLSLLSELCEQKVKDFSTAIEEELRTAGNGENRTVPVLEVLARHKEYRAYVKSDAGKIATEVSSAIKKFVSGTATDIIDGVASLVTTGLEAIIGAGTGTQQEMSSYYIVVQDYGIARYDIRAWARQIEASGITSQIETALAIVAFKSSVDITKLSFNTFLIAYAGQLSLMNIPPDKQKEYLAYAKEIYDQLRQNSGPTVESGAPALASSVSGPLAFGRFRAPGELYGTVWD